MQPNRGVNASSPDIVACTAYWLSPVPWYLPDLTACKAISLPAVLKQLPHGVAARTMLPPPSRRPRSGRSALANDARMSLCSETLDNPAILGAEATLRVAGASCRAWWGRCCMCRMSSVWSVAAGAAAVAIARNTRPSRAVSSVPHQVSTLGWERSGCTRRSFDQLGDHPIDRVSSLANPGLFETSRAVAAPDSGVSGSARLAFVKPRAPSNQALAILEAPMMGT